MRKYLNPIRVTIGNIVYAFAGINEQTNCDDFVCRSDFTIHIMVCNAFNSFSFIIDGKCMKLSKDANRSVFKSGALELSKFVITRCIVSSFFSKYLTIPIFIV